jgi:hypothetical protein
MFVPAHDGARVPLRAPRLRWLRGVKSKTAMVVMQMAYSRQWVADSLRHMGYTQAADDALRVLPEEVDRQQVEEFCQRYGISRDELVSRMGGSP